MKAVVENIEKIGLLVTWRGRGRKPLFEVTITDVVTAVIERNSISTFGNSSTRGLVQKLDVNTSTVWKILRNFSQFYADKY